MNTTYKIRPANFDPQTAQLIDECKDASFKTGSIMSAVSVAIDFLRVTPLTPTGDSDREATLREKRSQTINILHEAHALLYEMWQLYQERATDLDNWEQARLVAEQAEAALTTGGVS